MKNSKKINALIFAIALVITVSVGCGKEKADKSVQVVEVWTESTHTKELVTEMVDEYNKTEGVDKGIKIDYKVFGSDYKQVVDMASAGGKLPDLFRLQEEKKNYIAKDSIIAIEDMPGGLAFLEKYKNVLQEGSNIVDGKTYSVPFNVNLIGLIYNKDLFKQYGIVDAHGNPTPPTTWSEVREYAKKMTNPKDKAYGFSIPLKWVGYADWCFLNPAVSSCGYSGYDYKEGKYNFNTIEPMFQFLKDIKSDNSVFPGAEGLDNDPARAQFAAGRIGMTIGALWDVGVYNDQFEAKCDWGVAEIPVIDVNHKYKQWMAVEEFIAISSGAKTKNLEKVFDVYKWFNDDKFLARMYEEGKYMPYDSEIIEKATKDPSKKGWKEFGDLVKVSSYLRKTPTSSIQGYSYADIINLTWAGKYTVKEAADDLTKRYNEDLEKSIAEGKIDNTKYEDKNFDNRRK